MDQLATMPEKFQLVRDNYVVSKGYRFTHHKNYRIFYTINHHLRSIFIHRILHAFRQWEHFI